jgi:hypothetical protein
MPRLARRRLTSQFCKVDLHDLKDGGWCMYLPAGFVRATEDSVSIDWRGYQFVIPLARTFPHLGGTRFWFECPQCRGRARIVYTPSFVCRVCRGLLHPSTRQSRLDRARARAMQIRRKLGGTGALLEAFPSRPPGMKHTTWLRMRAKAAHAEQTANVLTMGFLERLSREKVLCRGRVRPAQTSAPADRLAGGSGPNRPRARSRP